MDTFTHCLLLYIINVNFFRFNVNFFEQDKAPTETVVVLKGLVEDGVMQLSDGRRITKSIEQGGDGTGDILIHPNFRMIVLANRCVLKSRR